MARVLDGELVQVELVLKEASSRAGILERDHTSTRAGHVFLMSSTGCLRVFSSWVGGAVVS